MKCYGCGSEEEVTHGVHADFCLKCRVRIREEQDHRIRQEWLDLFTAFVHQTHDPQHTHVGKECVTCRANLADLLRFGHRHAHIIFPQETP